MLLSELPFPIHADELILPKGKVSTDFDWFWRINDIDRLASSNDYHWPYPGHRAKSPIKAIVGNGSACPSEGTGGLCLARTLGGAQSGGRPLAGAAVLVCGILPSPTAILGEELAKIRVGKAWVAAQVSWRRLIFAGANLSDGNLHSANLSYADLGSANLSYADLRNVNLHDANLHSANLHSANLSSANLRKANLGSANLSNADLRNANLHDGNLGSANLGSADLGSANLSYANLSSVNLHSANLSYANLSSVNLHSANLHSANLGYANLSNADLSNAEATRLTIWPEGFTVPPSVTVLS